MFNLNEIFPPIKNEFTGKSVQCSCPGCRRVARHIHHIIPQCEGGTDDWWNLRYMCAKCHAAHHSAQGDFARWGKIGGKLTAEKMVSIPNLKQFKGEAGRARWEAYCQRRVNQQMGIA